MKKISLIIISSVLCLMCRAQMFAPTPDVGSPYTDMTMKDMSGRTVRVSDYVKKNKYTLIDFWASWCVPCCKEMPNVVTAYNKFRAKGFGVVGVSLDGDAKAWKAAVQRLGLKWPQMSELKGWESSFVSIYKIQGIPYNVLVNRKGIIVAVDLREEFLQRKLATLMK